ncbi:MAG: FHA domain-containing protein [Armatimonadota bacterium]
MNLIARRTVFSRLLDPGAAQAVRTQCLAGAAAGFVAFHLTAPASRWLASSMPDSEWIAPPLLAFSLVTTSTLSAALAAADELRSGSATRLARRGALAGGIGAALGLAAGILISGVLAAAPVPLVPAGLVTGATAGASLGLLSRSSRRAAAAAGGGSLGGLVGGLLALPIGALLGPELAPLPVMVVFGAAAALGLALGDQVCRACWLAFLSEPREGQIVPIYRSPTRIGRSDSAEVPLFGDRSLAAEQAVLTLTPTPVIREVSAIPMLHVNGEPVRQAALWDGALVEIGKHCFRFRHPRFPGGVAGTPSPLAAHVQQILESETTVIGAPAAAGHASPGELAQPLPDPEDRTIAMPPVSGLALRVEQSLIPLGGTVTIGREEDNRIRLADAKVSRHHARIEPRSGAWVLRDLGSRNGTRVNGVRVVRSGLLPGDVIAVGDTLLIVEAV